MPKNRPVPTLGLEAAKKLMDKVFNTDTLDVAVFVNDRGGPREISIIRNGDGQSPIAFIDQATYDALLASKDIHLNNMVEYKSRKNHQYRGSGWLGEFGELMQGAATAVARLSSIEKGGLERIVRQVLGEKKAPPNWEYADGYYRGRLDDVGLMVTFGWSMNGGRYLASVRRLPKSAKAA
jgi:hypothetical protein